MNDRWYPKRPYWWQTVAPSGGDGGLLGTATQPNDEWASSAVPLAGTGGILGHLSQPEASLTLAAIDRDVPIKDAPVTSSSPFDFTLEGLQNRFLWNKLMFDPRPLPMNPFFSSDSNLTPGQNWFDRAPMNPQWDAPILPPQFRRAQGASWSASNS